MKDNSLSRPWPHGTPVRGRLAVRLALVYGLISTMVITLMGLSIYLLTAHYLRDREESNLEGLADFYAAYAAQQGERCY